MTEADIASVVALDASASAEQLREELVRSWARLRVARVAHGEIVGYVLFWHVTDEIHLLNVAVASVVRRRGIGRALVDEVIRYARANGARKVLLEARASNEAALRLYEGFGFERFNVRARYYADGEDGVEMVLELE